MQKLGLRFQRRVGRTLLNEFGKTLAQGQWIEFEDANGKGYAQPDFFLVRADRIVCWEVKLRQTAAAISQIMELYRPLLWHLFRLPVVGVATFHYLDRTILGPEIFHPQDVIAMKPRELVHVWHVT